MATKEESELLDSLREFAAQRPEVLALYVFGSFASGTSGPLSDLDVALLVDTEAVAERLEEQPLGPKVHYIAELQAALGRSDVDVVLLHRATPLLAHRVIDRGRLVFCRNERARARFHARALMRYLDTRPLRQLERSYLRRRLGEDRFGRAEGHRARRAGRTETGLDG
jgi:predicted nucleotidyltransferase